MCFCLVSIVRGQLLIRQCSERYEIYGHFRVQNSHQLLVIAGSFRTLLAVILISGIYNEIMNRQKYYFHLVSCACKTKISLLNSSFFSSARWGQVWFTQHAHTKKGQFLLKKKHTCCKSYVRYWLKHTHMIVLSMDFTALQPAKILGYRKQPTKLLRHYYFKNIVTCCKSYVLTDWTGL